MVNLKVDGDLVTFEDNGLVRGISIYTVARYIREGIEADIVARRKQEDPQPYIDYFAERLAHYGNHNSARIATIKKYRDDKQVDLRDARDSIDQLIPREE